MRSRPVVPLKNRQSLLREQANQPNSTIQLQQALFRARDATAVGLDLASLAKIALVQPLEDVRAVLLPRAGAAQAQGEDTLRRLSGFDAGGALDDRQVVPYDFSGRGLQVPSLA